MWVIGKTLADNLTRLGVPVSGWIYQPRAARGGSRVDMTHGWADLLRAIAEQNADRADD